MSRSNYSDEYDEQFPNASELYRNSICQALAGRRGQAFLHELIEALDAMPEKRLIAGLLEDAGAVCAIGSVGKSRGMDMSQLDPEDTYTVAKAFGIAECMVREITFENDIGRGYRNSPENRWVQMRQWAESQIKK